MEVVGRWRCSTSIFAFLQDWTFSFLWLVILSRMRSQCCTSTFAFPSSLNFFFPLTGHFVLSKFPAKRLRNILLKGLMPNAHACVQSCTTRMRSPNFCYKVVAGMEVLVFHIIFCFPSKIAFLDVGHFFPFKVFFFFSVTRHFVPFQRSPPKDLEYSRIWCQMRMPKCKVLPQGSDLETFSIKYKIVSTSFFAFHSRLTFSMLVISVIWKRRERELLNTRVFPAKRLRRKLFKTWFVTTCQKAERYRWSKTNQTIFTFTCVCGCTKSSTKTNRHSEICLHLC